MKNEHWAFYVKESETRSDEEKTHLTFIEWMESIFCGKITRKLWAHIAISVLRQNGVHLHSK